MIFSEWLGKGEGEVVFHRIALYTAEVKDGLFLTTAPERTKVHPQKQEEYLSTSRARLHYA